LGVLVAGTTAVGCAGTSTSAVAPAETARVVAVHPERVSNAPVSDGLRASYSFDEEQGSYTTEALSRARAPVYLASRMTGRSGNALGFGTESARAELLPVGPFAEGMISVELWVRPDSLAADATAHLIGDGGGGIESFRLQLRGGKVVLLLASDGSWQPEPIVLSNRALEVGRWQLVTVTFDGSTARVYLDGVEDVAKPVMFPVLESANTLFVGALGSQNNGAFTDQFDGAIDEIRIWDRTVPAEVVAAHFRAVE
jgi:hypothetical protein